MPSKLCHGRKAAARIRCAATVLSLVLVVSCGFGSQTEPIVTPIAGRTFRVISVDGRSLPTTIGMAAATVGGCPSLNVAGILFAFNTDGSFVETLQYATGAATPINRSFVEPRSGEMAIVGGGDTASVQHDTLRFRHSGIMCGKEVLLAVPGS
jgi:hypothetical protein